MTFRLEHANLSVRDIDGMIRFLQTAFPEFQIRHEGITEEGLRWVHIGIDVAYLALNQATEPPQEPWVPYEGKPGVNHLGFEVDDVESLRARLLAGGYTDSTVNNHHPYRKRAYFYDPEGNDWEFVQYLTEDPAERHDYEIADR